MILLNNEDVDALYQVFAGQPPRDQPALDRLHEVSVKLREDIHNRMEAHHAAIRTGTVSE